VEVDAALLSDPAVAEAASFGVPDPIYGEEVQAAVVPKAEVSAEELQARCRDQLADYKVPKVIHFVKELPRDAAGKVERRRLTELFSK
jgi:acyl-coenzyme A synthetase/AMP-(fatty) acid ligase